MLKFDIPVDNFFEGYQFYDKIGIAAEIGYDGVEIVGGFRTLDAYKIRRICEKYNIPIVNFTMNEPRKLSLDRPFGEIGEEYISAMRFLHEAGAENLLVIGGGKQMKGDDPRMIVVENLKRLAEWAQRYQVSLNLEPVNNIIEHRDQLYSTSAMVYEAVKCVNSPWVNITYDVLHLQVQEGNIIRNMVRMLPFIRHVHISALPLHHEPFYFEVDCHNLLRQLESCGYDRFVGLEYFPSYNSFQSAADSLHYMKDYVRKGLISGEPYIREGENDAAF